MDEIGLLVGIVMFGAVWYALALSWFEAQTTWLSRLSARGLLDGRYEPYRGGGWGSPRWVLRQRVAPSDLLKVEGLKREVDGDSTTELWRTRMNQRARLLWITAPVVLIAPFAISALLDRL